MRLLMTAVLLCVSVTTARGAMTYTIGNNASPEVDVLPSDGLTGNRFIIGSGFGSGSSSLLDVTFNVLDSLPGTTNVLNTWPNPGSVWTIQFGTVTFAEDNIDSSETDNLEVTAVVRLINPLSPDQDLMDLAVQANSISSSGDGWWKLDFGDTITVNFGLGGKFQYAFGFDDDPSHPNYQTSYTFDSDKTKKLYVTFKHIADAPEENELTPEPASLAIWSTLGVMGLVAARRRRLANVA